MDAPITGDERLQVEGGFGHRALLQLVGYNFNKVIIDATQGKATDSEHSAEVEYGAGKTFEKGLEDANTINPEFETQLRADISSFLDNFSPDRNMATVGTPSSAKGDGDAGRFKIDGIEFANQHAYSIVRTLKPNLSPDGIGRVFVTNPWNTARVIELTYPQFMKTFSQISGVEINYSKIFRQVNPAQKVAA